MALVGLGFFFQQQRNIIDRHQHRPSDFLSYAEALSFLPHGAGRDVSAGRLRDALGDLLRCPEIVEEVGHFHHSSKHIETLAAGTNAESFLGVSSLW